MKLTTDHPASSYGIPVLVDDDGNAFGPADVIPAFRVTAAEYVSIAAHHFGEENASAFCASWPEGPQPGRDTGQIYSDAANRKPGCGTVK